VEPTLSGSPRVLDALLGWPLHFELVPAHFAQAQDFEFGF
jgi:hypothetical protein